jgi:hypothetical protein
MGCMCTQPKSTYEIICDEIWASLPLRKIDGFFIYKDFQENIEINSIANIDVITFENFQKIYRKYELDKIQEKSLEKYWESFFKNKPLAFQLPFTLFQFILLSNNSEPDIHMCVEIISIYLWNRSQIDICNESDASKTYLSTIDREQLKKEPHRYINALFLYELLYDYIYSITNLTTDTFSQFHYDPLSFKKTLNSLWTQEIIEGFVKKRFFKKSHRSDTKIEIFSFVKQNIKSLMNDSQIRAELTDFHHEYILLDKVEQRKIKQHLN